MQIKSEKIILELDDQEARQLAYHIKSSLEKSIKSHYVTLQDFYEKGIEHAKEVFEEQCRKDLNMMNDLMACASGQGDWMEKEVWLYLEKEYEERHRTV